MANASIAGAMLFAAWSFKAHGLASLDTSLIALAAAILYRTAVGVVFTVYREK